MLVCMLKNSEQLTEEILSRYLFIIPVIPSNHKSGSVEDFLLTSFMSAWMKVRTHPLIPSYTKMPHAKVVMVRTISMYSCTVPSVDLVRADLKLLLIDRENQIRKLVWSNKVDFLLF